MNKHKKRKSKSKKNDGRILKELKKLIESIDSATESDRSENNENVPQNMAALARDNPKEQESSEKGTKGRILDTRRHADSAA